MAEELREPSGASGAEISEPTGGEAERVRELEALREQAGRALALLDAGQLDAARAQLGTLLEVPAAPLTEPPASAADVYAAPSELEPVWNPPPPAPRLDFDHQLGDDELDQAFESAEADREQMHDVNRVAERVLEETEPEASKSGAFPAGLGVFATETMAELLEGQGHVEPAQAIRATLHVAAPEADEGEGNGAWQESDAYAETWPGEAFVNAEPVEDEAFEIAGSDPLLASGARTMATLERWLENVRRDVA